MSSQVESNPLLSKIRKILDIELDTDENLLSSLNSLSDVLPVNTVKHRRNLRSQVEKRQADLYEAFLNEFASVQQGVDSLDSHIQIMLQSCQEINEHLTRVKHKASGLIDEASSLQEHRHKCGLKLQLLNCLADSFQVSAKDRDTLCSPNATVDSEFLEALARAQGIENSCKQLVQSGGQHFGFGLLDASHALLDTAYQHLYQFVQVECRSKTQESPDFSPVLRSSIRALLNRPALFKCALDEYVNARRTTTVKSFINSLTLGDLSCSFSKPIDLRSHDPVRYVSDILACVHQLVASEKEYLKALTKNCTDEPQTVEEFLTVSLDSITEGLCSPSKMRLEQLLVSSQDPVLLYKVNNVLRFYEHTLCGLLGSSCQVSTTLAEVCELSWRLLFSCLQQYMRQTLDQWDYPGQDLAASHAIRDTLDLMVEIVRSHDVSLLSPEVRQASFNEITKTIVGPLITHCQSCADRFQHTAFSDAVLPGTGSDKFDDLIQLSCKAKAATYLINCYYLIEATLVRLNSATEQVEQVAHQLSTSLDHLVAIQVSAIMRRTGLYRFMHILEQGAEESEISEAGIRDALARFDAYLSRPDHLSLPELQLLDGQRLKKLVRRRSADEIHSRYQLFYQAITDPTSAYSSLVGEGLANIRTPQQVAELILNF